MTVQFFLNRGIFVTKYTIGGGGGVVNKIAILFQSGLFYLTFFPLCRYDVPYYQYPEPPPPQRRILDGTENREFGGGGRGVETRDYMGGLEIVEEPPSQYTIPIAPQIVS